MPVVRSKSGHLDQRLHSFEVCESYDRTRGDGRRRVLLPRTSSSTAKACTGSIGSNEVPKAGGGTYWSDGDVDDRDFVRQHDSNEQRKNEPISHGDILRSKQRLGMALPTSPIQILRPDWSTSAPNHWRWHRLSSASFSQTKLKSGQR